MGEWNPERDWNYDLCERLKKGWIFQGQCFDRVTYRCEDDLEF
jgi:hypothetical protein